MVQQQKSWALTERLSRIEDSLHNVNLRNNIVQEAASHKTYISELKMDP